MDRRTALSRIGMGAGLVGYRTELWGATPWGAVLSGAVLSGAGPSSDWDGEELPWPEQTPHPVTTALAAAPSQRHFASVGDDHLVHLWQLEPPQIIAHLAGHRDWIRSVIFLDNQRLITGSNDGTLRLWDRSQSTTRGTVLRRSASPWTVLAQSRSAGTWAAGSFSGHVEWFDAATTRRLGHIDLETNDLRCAAFSPEGRQLVVSGRDGKLYVIDVTTGKLVHTRPTGHRRRRALVHIGNGRVISGGDDGIVCVSSALGNEACHDVQPARARIDCMVRWDDEYVAVGGSDNRIRLVHAENGRVAVELKGHTGTVAALCRIDSMLLSSGFDTTIRLWTPKTSVAGRARDDDGWRSR